MSSLNKACLLGHLGADPEVRRTQDGAPIVNLRLATTETWKDRATQERKERTEWHRVVIFNEGLAKVAEAYLKKGSQCYIEGAIQTRKWTDQQGQERYSTEIVLQKFNGELKLLGGKSEDRSEPSNSYARGKAGEDGTAPAIDDEIPW